VVRHRLGISIRLHLCISYDIDSDSGALIAWIPTWAFGRRFVGGKSIERTPETNLAILLGTFGSAFTATLADYYKEVKPIMSKTLSGSMDAYIEEVDMHSACYTVL